MAISEDTPDASMLIVQKLWERAKSAHMTQQQIGVAMGYPEPTARKSVNQFLKSEDPRISMLRKFAKAVGVPISEIVG